MSDNGQFHPGYVLLDPYSTKSVPVVLPEAYYNTAPNLPPILKMEDPVWMGLLASLTEDQFDWQGAYRPFRGPAGASAGGRQSSPEDMVLIDLDIPSFTQVGAMR